MGQLKFGFSSSDKEPPRLVTHDLLDSLKREKLVLDWCKRRQSRALVRLAIEERLDQLPDRYLRELYQQKCEVVYQHVYDVYVEPGRSVYAQLA